MIFPWTTDWALQHNVPRSSRIKWINGYKRDIDTLDLSRILKQSTVNKLAV